MTVLIPSLPERHDQLRMTVASYQKTAPGCQVLTTTGFTTPEAGWGAGINHLADQAEHEMLLMGSDDAVPRPGWLEAGLEALRRGKVPAARFIENGQPCEATDAAADWEPVFWTRIFLLPSSVYRTVGPLLDVTWYGDLDYSDRLKRAGWPIVARDGFTFDHARLPRLNWDDGAHAVAHQAYLDAKAARETSYVSNQARPTV